MEPPEDLIRVREAAKVAGVCVDSIYQWIHKGKIRAWRLGSRYFVSRAELAGMFQAYVPKTGIPTDSQWEERHAESRRILKAARMI